MAEKIYFYMFEAPFNVVRDMTIPNFDEWKRKREIFKPILASILFFTFGFYELVYFPYLIAISIFFALPFSLLIRFKTRTKVPPMGPA